MCSRIDGYCPHIPSYPPSKSSRFPTGRRWKKNSLFPGVIQTFPSSKYIRTAFPPHSILPREFHFSSLFPPLFESDFTSPSRKNELVKHSDVVCGPRASLGRAPHLSCCGSIPRFRMTRSPPCFFFWLDVLLFTRTHIRSQPSELP
jgi:hypothetical protein